MRGFAPGLIPCELWSYGTLDAFRGVRAALSTRESPESISLPGLADCVPVRAARVGIVLALRALNLGRGARVGVPLFCCPVVFKAIEAAGCVPRFLDVDPATFCISPDDLATKRGEIDALVAVHMFGNVCDVPRLRALAPGLPIVEDCAQSLGSALRDRPTGQFGDLAVFSFRAGKYISVGQGGAVFTADPDLHSRVLELAGEMPLPSHAEECGHVVRSFARAQLRSRPLYGVIGSPLWRAYARLTDYSSQSPLIMGRIYRADLRLISERLPGLASALAKRRAYAEIYATLLAGQSLTLCAEPPGVRYNRYQYPVLFPSSAHRQTVADYLFSHRVDVSRPYSDCVDIATAHHRYTGDCPVSGSVAQQVLAVPNHERLTRAEVQSISERISESLRKLPSPDRLSEACYAPPQASSHQ